MCPIPIRQLIAGARIPVDLYVRIAENKFITIAKAGSLTQVERFLNYENKQLDVLWVRREDYQKFVGMSVAIAGELSKQDKVKDAQKNSVLCQAASSVLSEIKDIGISLESYEHARVVSEATLVLVEKNFDLFAALRSLAENSEMHFNHSVAVSMLSVMLAKSHGWQKPATLEKISLGALLHDIGKRELPPDLLNKARSQMSFDEIATYETHPFRGMELLRTIGIVPDDILSIVYEHHENALGQGYPRRLKDLRINPLARLVGLANQFIDLVRPIQNNAKVKTAQEAVQFIEITMGQPYNKEAFRALKNIVLRSGGMSAA